MLLYLRQAIAARLAEGVSLTPSVLDAALRDGAVLRVRPEAMTDSAAAVNVCSPRDLPFNALAAACIRIGARRFAGRYAGCLMNITHDPASSTRPYGPLRYKLFARTWCRHSSAVALIARTVSYVPS